MSERKPCPFCGSSNATLDYYEISGPQELGTIVVCNDCGASAKSIVDWNTRPIEDALNARIAELEAAQARWVMVSERLPNKSGWYRVGAIDVFDEGYTDEAYFGTMLGWRSPVRDEIYCWLDGVPELPKPPEVQA